MTRADFPLDVLMARAARIKRKYGTVPTVTRMFVWPWPRRNIILVKWREDAS